MRRLCVASLLAASALLHCGGAAAPESARLSTIEPAGGPADRPQPVTIRGRGLDPTVSATARSPGQALGPPDDQAGAMTGALGDPSFSWQFRFDRSQLGSGPILADVTLVLWQSGYADDSIVLELSEDGGGTFATLTS